MSHTFKRAALTLALGFGLIGSASAAMETIDGLHTTFTFDDALVGLYGMPQVSGDTIFFTPTSFVASSSNGAGVDYANATFNITVSAKAGYTLNGIDLSESGDYLLYQPGSVTPQAAVAPKASIFAGSQVGERSNRNWGDHEWGKHDGHDHQWSDHRSSERQREQRDPAATAQGLGVDVTGQIRVRDLATLNEVTSSITPTGPMTTLGLPSHNWSAGADTSFATASSVNLTIENILLAYTTASGSLAFIEKKFVGADVSVMAVPEPESYAMLLAGLGLLGAIVRRRKAA